MRSAPREHPWRTHSKKRKVSGECNVIAYFIDDEKTKLCVRVTRAKDIKAADLGGTSDPYVRATLTTPIKDPETGREDQIFKTKVVWKTIEPTWNHNFIFRVWPSTDAQIKAAETTKIGVLGTIVNGVYGGLDSFKKATGCKKIDEVEARERREKREVKAKLKALKREEKARKKKRAYKASDFKTIDVAARAKRDAIERRAMITSLGGRRRGRRRRARERIRQKQRRRRRLVRRRRVRRREWRRERRPDRERANPRARPVRLRRGLLG